MSFDLVPVKIAVMVKAGHRSVAEIIDYRSISLEGETVELGTVFFLRRAGEAL